MSTFPARRPRRLRTTPAMRNLVAETQVRPSDLILPMFIVDGLDAPREIPSMPGVYQHTFDSLRRAAEEAERERRAEQRPAARRRSRCAAADTGSRSSSASAPRCALRPAPRRVRTARCP